MFNLHSVSQEGRGGADAIDKEVSDLPHSHGGVAGLPQPPRARARARTRPDRSCSAPGVRQRLGLCVTLPSGRRQRTSGRRQRTIFRASRLNLMTLGLFSKFGGHRKRLGGGQLAWVLCVHIGRGGRPGAPPLQVQSESRLKLACRGPLKARICTNMRVPPAPSCSRKHGRRDRRGTRKPGLSHDYAPVSPSADLSTTL